MSCQKLCRQSLHIVLSQGRGSYSLTRVDVSTLFYPSTAEAEAEAEAPTAKKNGINIQPLMARLPEPSTHYRRPLSRSAPVILDVFALLGKRMILCADAAEGSTFIYDTETHAFWDMPPMNSPKHGHRCIAIYIPHQHDGDHAADSLYVLDMAPNSPCSFELLAYHHPVRRWRWRPLPPPPFLDDLEFTPPDDNAFAVFGGTRIFVSTGRATYSFDTVVLEWSKAGDWVPPFLAKAEHDAGLGLWLGMSAASPYDLCAMDISAAAGDTPPRVVPRVGLDVYPQANWYLRKGALVNVGPGRFCTAKIFDVADEQHGEYASSLAVFTGMEVVTDDDDRQRECRLHMVKHRSECLATGTDSIECVL